VIYFTSNAVEFMSDTHNQPSVYETIGRNIRRARRSSGLSQEELAKRLSLSRTSVTNIEKGRQRLLVHTLFQVAGAVSARIEDLLANVSGSLSPKPERLLPDTLDGDAREWVLTHIRAVSE
jgi:transcriptional regulator with XRE-family HTH domain